MPIKIPNDLPAKETLVNENIFVMTEQRAFSQDIRPLRIALLNLMPTKVATETQILRLIGNSPIQVDVVLLHPATYKSKHISEEHLLRFYNHFDEIKDQRFDGLIITGAPVELMDFHEVAYWEELERIMEWSRRSVYSTFHICWGAQAGLYHHYGIQKHELGEKLFGVFPHTCTKKHVKLLRGFDDLFYVPHSRYTCVYAEDIEREPELEVLSTSDEAGLYIAASKDGRQIFVTGHSEYDPLTLSVEYFRDKEKGLDTAIPKNYFERDDPERPPVVLWRGHSNLLYSNWLNYYVYQETPYDLGNLR